ncbi:unnamed protein product, partial [Rotaria sp. Silwood2]
MDCSHRLGA